MNIAQAAKLPKGSTVAGISMEGLSADEARNKLMQAVERWKSNGTIAMKSNEETYLIPRSAFQFDIEKTLAELEEKTKRRWYRLFLKPKNVHISLHVAWNEKDGIEWPDYVDKQATIDEAIQIAKELGEREGKLVYEENPNPLKIADVNFQIPTNLSDDVLNNLLDQMNDLQLDPQTDFSFIEQVLEPLNMAKSSEEASFIGSALYALALQSNIEIVERHSQGKVPSYTQPGVEAEISRVEKKDLKLYNPNFYSYFVKAEKRGNRLAMALHIAEQEASYEYRVANVKEIKPRVVYRYSSKLNPGEKQTLQAGSNGLKVEVYREKISESGNVDNSELISRDYYPPRPTIILVSSLSVNNQDPEQQTQEENDDSQLEENVDEEANLRDVRDEIDELNELISSIRPNPIENKTNDDPFQALKELEEQLNELLELIQHLALLINMSGIQCESINDEETRTLCEKMQERFRAAERGAIPTMR